jgi:lanthanide-dependent methanol dehydrogenase
LNVANNEIAWRAYSTGPDEDVLIGPNFKPFYEQDRDKDLGVTTWLPDMWRIGGGTVWGWISYDPELNLIYYGTANPGPWNPEMRPGDNKWTATIFARNPDNGEAIWAYQWEPHDEYDYDGVNENVLLDLLIQGQERKVLVRPERNGHVYVLDRTTGQVLSAETYVHVTVSKGVDLKTGRPNKVEEKKTGFGRVVKEICPAAPGGKDWQPRPGPLAPGCSTSPTRTSVWTWKGSKLTTSPGRHSSAPNTDVWRTGWPPRRVHGLGSGRPEKSLEHHRALPGVERRGGDRR